MVVLAGPTGREDTYFLKIDNVSKQCWIMSRISSGTHQKRKTVSHNFALIFNFADLDRQERIYLRTEKKE
jgi:hypothetical protein